MALEGHAEHWLDIDGTRTRYFAAGKGRRVVLIHGGMAGDATASASAEDWALNFDELARQHRVIALDRLGQGHTGNPSGTAAYAMAASVRHTARFLELIGEAPYNLIGHGRGGYVAARVTLEHPRLVESCVIVDSATAAPGASRRDIVHAANPHGHGTPAASRWAAEQSSFSAGHVSEDWIAAKQKIAALPETKAAVARMRDEGLDQVVFETQLIDDREAFFRMLDGEGLKRPALVYWGYNDPTAPVDLGLRLFAAIGKQQPRTRMHMVNKAGHYSFRERAAEFNRVIAEFVEGASHGA